jgi:23S rRNA (adenine2503-C2)-methyltransferase
VSLCAVFFRAAHLIEYNPIDDGEFQQASEEATNAYIKALSQVA